MTDLSGLTADEQEAGVRRYVEAQSQRPIDLATGPLARIELLKLSDEQHVVLVGLHHIIYDGWSMAVLWRELLTIYRAFSAGLPSSLPELPIQYADYAVWQRDRLQGEVLAGLRGYWAKQLEGLPTLELPTDRPRRAVQTSLGAVCERRLPRELSQAVAGLSRQEQATTFMTLMAAFETLLGRYSGQEDFGVGTPVAGRLRSETEGLIGYFVNTLVLRADLAGDPQFRELLSRVRDTATVAFDHQEMPFERLVDELDPRRDLSRHPVFQAMFVLQNTPQESQDLGELEISGVESTELGGRAEEFDLVLSAEEGAEGIALSMNYRTDLFEESSIARMLEHFETLLEGLVADPGQRISQLPLMTDEERQKIVVDWNRTEVDFPELTCVHELVEAQAAATPDNVAAVFEGQMTTYGQLNAQANQLAHYLRELGVGAEVPVGICIERSLDMVVAMLAVMKAGGAYVPLDPDYPRERIDMVADDCRPAVVLTTSAVADRFSAPAARVVCLDASREQIAGRSRANPSSQSGLDNAMCILYTSGSTGKPKGAVLPHRGMANYLLYRRRFLGLDAGDRMLLKTPISFDLSIDEMFVTLISGSRLVIAKEGGQREPDYLVQLCTQEGVTTALFVPTLLRAFLNEPHVGSCRTLNQVSSGGETLPVDLMELFVQRLDADLYNIYGPVETLVAMTSWTCDPESKLDSVPIGRPISNADVYP